LRLAIALPSLVLLGRAEAGTITVADTGTSTASTCTLAQAINAANAVNGVSAASVGSSTPAGNCTGAAPGLNYITFSGWPTITLTSIDNYWYGPNALPPIASTIWIGAFPGTGARLVASHTGDPNPATADAFRFFYVSGGLTGELPAGYLVMIGMALEGGYAKGGDAGSGGGGAGMGGAIFNQGGLELTAVSLIGNVAKGGGTGVNGSTGGGGMGQEGGTFGGGFGGGLGGNFGGAGKFVGSGSIGGGGGGFTTTASGDLPNGGGVGRLGGAGGGYGGIGGDGGGGGGQIGGNNGGASGGRFGSGGAPGGYDFGQTSGGGGAGGGGVGGGGGGVDPDGIGGGGGFGGGAGTRGTGGIGGGGGEATAFGGGFGGGSGTPGSYGAGGGGAGMGGAVFNHRGSVYLLDVTATGNAARGGAGNGSGLGAVLFNLNGMATIDFSTLAGNTLAGSNAAGDASGASDGTVYSLAYGDKIEDGSASSASLKINKSIIRATHVDGGNANDDVAVNVVNGTQANASSLAYVGQSLIPHSYTTAGVNQSGSSPNTADPHLGALTLSATWSLKLPVLPIGPDSPAHDAVNCLEANGSGTILGDERNAPRPEAGGTLCDIGAYEFDGDYIFADGYNNGL